MSIVRFKKLFPDVPIGAPAFQEKGNKQLIAARAKQFGAQRPTRRKVYTPDEIMEAIDSVRRVPHASYATAMRALNISEAELYRWITKRKLMKYKKGYVYSANVLQVIDRGIAERKQ